MKSSVFLMLMIGLLVWGGTVGAAFAGGVGVGKAKAEASATTAPATSTTAASSTAGSTPSTKTQSQAQPQAQTPTPTQPQAGTQDQQNLRQQLNSGTPLTQEQLDALRQQFQNRQGAGGTGGAGTGGAGTQGFALRGGLQGTVEQVNGNTISINTAQGTLQATLTATTQINAVTSGKAADIAVGAEVIVTGQRAADGTTQAASVFIVPQGFTGLPGIGGAGGGRGGAGTGAGGTTTGGA